MCVFAIFVPNWLENWLMYISLIVLCPTDQKSISDNKCKVDVHGELVLTDVQVKYWEAVVFQPVSTKEGAGSSSCLHGWEKKPLFDR